MTRKRCAIYTRKSTEEGLDQTFNSLDAQKEACGAFISSQRHEGWQVVRKAYDDGGFSGGSMERPALKALMMDVSSGLVDVIVVYKIDRLTRSLADFAKMVEVFDAKGVSFVSVTQQFNTTTSMGRLTLNVLLSFAQFEREVTAERIRDKIAASRKKGMWMGGPPPLGYDVRDKSLVVNEVEAETVRQLFEAYVELGSVKALTGWARGKGITTKIRRDPNGNVRAGGRPFSRGNLHALLNYRAYIGEVTHRENIYRGEQDAIVPRELWDRVHARFADGKAGRRTTSSGETSLLTGLLFDDTDDRLTPTYASKKGRRYRYYVSSRLIEIGSDDPTGWRLPALEIEGAVLAALAARLRNPQELMAMIGDSNLAASHLTQVLKAAPQLADSIQRSASVEKSSLIKTVVSRITIASGTLVLKIRHSRLLQSLGLAEAQATNTGHMDDEQDITVPYTLRRRGVETMLIVGDGQRDRSVDPVLVGTLAKAHSWFNQLAGSAVSINDIAEQQGLPASEISRLLPLAFLAPDIVEAIIDGRQPPELTAKHLKRFDDLPLDWCQQRKVLGFPILAHR
ncbi:recombinase family protein [Aestuariivirga sp.]|uniref:recombinase family protein n=1 Tax=Aestuariivirga sp. TaxID=2650926 RepID=UPI003BAC21A2